MQTLSQQVSRPVYDDLGAPEPIEPIFAEGTDPTLEDWQDRRAVLKERWNAVLGTPSLDTFDTRPEIINTFEQPAYRATVFKQPTGPDTRQTLLFMEPGQAPGRQTRTQTQKGKPAKKAEDMGYSFRYALCGRRYSMVWRESQKDAAVLTNRTVVYPPMGSGAYPLCYHQRSRR